MDNLAIRAQLEAKPGKEKEPLLTLSRQRLTCREGGLPEAKAKRTHCAMIRPMFFGGPRVIIQGEYFRREDLRGSDRSSA